MTEPDAAPQKIRITPELIAEWTRDAGVLLDANCTRTDVIRDLRERGCTPKLAEQIVAKAKGPVRTAHRVLGVRAVFIGGGMILIGWLLSLGLHHSVRAWEFIAGGGAVAAVGGFKLLTGSAVDLDRITRPQDYLD